MSKNKKKHLNKTLNKSSNEYDISDKIDNNFSLFQLIKNAGKYALKAVSFIFHFIVMIIKKILTGIILVIKYIFKIIAYFIEGIPYIIRAIIDIIDGWKS